MHNELTLEDTKRTLYHKTPDGNKPETTHYKMGLRDVSKEFFSGADEEGPRGGRRRHRPSGLRTFHQQRSQNATSS